MASQFWVISVPIDKAGGEDPEAARNRTWRGLHAAVSDMCHPFQFQIPDLRVGTLDSLLALSDDLVRSCNSAEQTAAKLHRQIHELQRSHGPGSTSIVEGSVGGLMVDGVPVERYLTAFQWDEAKHPHRRPCKETVESVIAGLAMLEEDLKVRTADYNSVKGQLATLARKAQGTLAVKDLSGLVPTSEIVDSENLTTLLVVVPRYSKKEWESIYHTLAQYVVPKSSKMLVEEGDYALFTVVLFKRVVDNFRTAASEKGFQVREFVPPAAASENNSGAPEVSAEAQQRELSLQHEQRRKELLEWSTTAYSEAVSSWLHLCAVRAFAESILRFGLPPSFLSVILQPLGKSEKKLRTLLADRYGRAQMHWKDEEEAAALAGVQMEEAHPYVSLTVNLLN